MEPSGMLFGAHELLGSIKHEECFEQTNDNWLLKKTFAP
jgi:hypothetical protein